MNPESLYCVCRDSMCRTPHGLCHCGCGEKTKVSTRTTRRLFLVRGQPKRYIDGHFWTERPLIEDAVPFKIDGVYCRLIPLNKGYSCIVDAADYLWLMRWKWFAWKSKDGNIYARRASRGNEDGQQRQILMHREILGLSHKDGHIGDHADCWSTLNNSRNNLRVADHSQSSVNTRRRGSICRLKGAHYSPKGKKKWSASIMFRHVKTPLGRFDTEKEAHAAYCEAAKRLHGNFARFE